MSRSRAPMLALAALFAAAPAAAAPTLSVSPAAIQADYAGTVQVTAGNLGGGSPSVILRLYVDINGDGLITTTPGASDYVVWTDLVADNAARWSLNMASDQDATARTVRVALAGFTPKRFPYTAGTYIWEAVDPNDGTTATSAFTVAQVATGVHVSGQVTLAGSPATAIPGALVLVLPFNGEAEAEGPSCMADSLGNYTLDVPLSLTCASRAVIALKPGYLTPVAQEPYVYFDGTNQIAYPVVQSAPRQVSGQVTYSSGPLNGLGVPGCQVTVEAAGGLPVLAVGVADHAGNYSIAVATGSWKVETDDEIALSQKGAVANGAYFVPVTVGGTDVTNVNLAVRHADAFLRGTVYADAGVTPVGAGLVVSGQSHACAGGDGANCFQTQTLTAADGSYTLGLVGGTLDPGAAPYQHDVRLARASIVPGKIQRGFACETLAADETKTGRDLIHLAAARHITGHVYAKNGGYYDDVAVSADQTASCYLYGSSALTACNTGIFDLPAVDGSWSVRFDHSDLFGYFRYMDVTLLQRPVVVAGADAAGVDFIVGEWLKGPYIAAVDPVAGGGAGPVLLRGTNFTWNAGSVPQVTWADALYNYYPATILAYRPDTGELYVTQPSPAWGAGRYELYVTNPDSTLTSNLRCFTLTSPSPGTCSLSGTVSPAMANALVVARQGTTRSPVGVALTDGTGAYTMTVENVGGPYGLSFVPPSGQPYAWASYETLSCGAVQNHAFSAGSVLSGTVRDAGGSPLSSALVTAILGSFQARTLTDSAGAFQVRLPASPGYTVRVQGPSGGRFLAQERTSVNLSSSVNLGAFTLDQGFFFVGYLQDAAGQPVADRPVEGYQTDTGAYLGRATTDPCTGRFSLPLAGNADCRLAIQSGVTPMTRVETLRLAKDVFSEYTFPVFTSADRQVTGGGPRFGKDLLARAQQGQPVYFMAENLSAPGLRVEFSDGAGGWVAGGATQFDGSRGLALTRVPVGAASGEVRLVTLDGGGATLATSGSHGFEVLAGTWSDGANTLQGEVTAGGGPVQGAMVLAFIPDPASSDCSGSDLGTLRSYAVTGADGKCTLAVPSGVVNLLFLPPVASGLGPGFEQRTVSGNLSVDKILLAGAAVTLRVVDTASPTPNPVPGAHVEFQQNLLSDFRVSDASGNVSFTLADGTYALSIEGPRLSRFLDYGGTAVVSGVTGLGDRALPSGLFVTERAASPSGVGRVGVEVEAVREAAPGESFGRALTGANGVGTGAVPGATLFRLDLRSGSDAVMDGRVSNLSVADDTVRYPSQTLGSAGVVAGTVRDTALTPLGNIGVAAWPASDTSGTASGSTSSCAGTGAYRLKIPPASYKVRFNDPLSGNPAYITVWYDSVYCPQSATALTVTEGLTTTANQNLPAVGTVAGSVQDSARVPLSGAYVHATGAALGTCEIGANSALDGTYSLRLPPGSFTLRASATGYPDQCWNHSQTCTSPAPAALAVTGGSTTPNVNFDLGYAPPEVSSSLSGRPLRLAKSGGQVSLTFATVSGAESYDIYVGTPRTYYAPASKYCYVGPTTPGFVNNGDGTATYTFTPGSADAWYFVSASNVVGEGPLGYSRNGLGQESEVDYPYSSWRCNNNPR